MDSTRKTAVITGLIFIIATVASLLAAALTPDLASTDYLARFAAQANAAAGGALLYLVSALTSAGIAISLYPVLREQNPGLALGSVVFRAVEAVFYMAGVASLLALPALGRQLAAAGAADRAALQAIGDALVSVRSHASLLAVFAFSTGGFMYYYLFFESRLIPRWLSGWGIVAIIAMLTACVLALFSGNPVTSYIPLALPIFLQEMVLAVWLIAKGFNPPVSPSQPAKREAKEPVYAA